MKKIQHSSLTIIYILLSCISTYGQIFKADPEIADPEIYFLNDSVLIIEYESMYDIHMSWDTLTYPGAGLSEPKFGKYDYFRLISDLMTALDLREYHFAPVWGDDDLLYGMVEHPITGITMNRMPGWIHFGRGNGYRAMNIGQDNTELTLGPLYPQWGKLKQMPHMNNVAQLDRSIAPHLNDKYGLSATLFHEIGHLGSAYFINSPATPLGWTPLNWEPWMPPLALVNGGSHWWPEQSNRWVNPVHSGLMPSAPRYLSYNWIDLYALGILTYEQIEDSVAWVRDPNTMIEYDIRREDLVNILEQYEMYINETPFEDLPTYLQDGDDYMEGNGIRIPNGDPSMLDLKTLLIVVVGEESVFDATDEHFIMRMAKEVPEDWSTATHGLSEMSTKITHKRINHFSKSLSGRSSVKIETEDFLNAFNNYQEAVLSHIRFETLPTQGTLNIDGIPVTAGVPYPIDVITNQDLVYTKTSSRGKFSGDSFEYNAKSSGRWAAPATITVIDNGMIFPGFVFDNNKHSSDVIVYPNSFDHELRISFQNDEESDVEVQIFDLSGRRIYGKLIENMGVGLQLILLDQLPKSNEPILNMTITSKNQSISRKLINKK